MSKRVAFIFGSGAVSNSWAPIFKCLTPFHFKKELSIEGANTALALLVYNLRHASSEKESVYYKNSLDILNRTRLGICEQIYHFQDKGFLVVRPELDQILVNFVLSGFDGYVFITTNWDTVVDDFLKSHPIFRSFLNNNKDFCIHLHGNFKKGNLIYLPTEVANEPYREEDEKKYMNDL